MIDPFCTNGSSPPQPERDARQGSPEPDLQLLGDGSVFLLRPITPAGSVWIEEHIPSDAMWFAGAVAIERKFIAAIVAGAIRDGLVVL